MLGLYRTRLCGTKTIPPLVKLSDWLLHQSICFRHSTRAAGTDNSETNTLLAANMHYAVSSLFSTELHSSIIFFPKETIGQSIWTREIFHRVVRAADGFNAVATFFTSSQDIKLDA